LQYALNLYQLDGRHIEDFNSDLAEELYGDLLASAAGAGLEKALSRLLCDPFARDPKHLLDLEAFLSAKFGHTSLMQIARALLAVKRSGCAPESVLTFNADVLLHTALTLLEIRQSHSSIGRLTPEFSYRPLYRSTDHQSGKTPIYHIHGSITPTPSKRESREKLVFPESSYSQLAAAVYAWPQTVFLSAAQASRILFVGLSMSDPNIRRWLSWCNGYRRDEIDVLGTAPDFSSQHIWITTRSKDPLVQTAKESGLLHLGVRTAFIPDWGCLEAAIMNLTGC
jgi:hypothetical protein